MIEELFTPHCYVLLDEETKIYDESLWDLTKILATIKTIGSAAAIFELTPNSYLLLYKEKYYVYGAHFSLYAQLEDKTIQLSLIYHCELSWSKGNNHFFWGEYLDRRLNDGYVHYLNLPSCSLSLSILDYIYNKPDTFLSNLNSLFKIKQL